MHFILQQRSLTWHTDVRGWVIIICRSRDEKAFVDLRVNIDRLDGYVRYKGVSWMHCVIHDNIMAISHYGQEHAQF